MYRFIGVCLILLVASGVTFAQDTKPAETQDLIKALLKRIEKLEKRLAELENRNGAAGVNGPKISLGSTANSSVLEGIASEAAVPERETSAEEAEPAQQEIPLVESRYPDLQFRGFTDIDFSATDEVGSVSGFNLGQFIFHVTSPLSKKINFFAEVSFSSRPTGTRLGLERAIIRYDYNDYFKVSFGKYHTPVNYWNTAFHHGLWLQTSIRRPEMTQFGGRFLPVHFVGLSAEGNIPSGGLGLNYIVGVGNGRSTVISGSGDAGDNNNNRAWLVNLFARPSKLYGLQVGTAIYHDKISVVGGPDLREWISSAHVVWTKGAPEVLVEFANVHHREEGTDRFFNSEAFYVQLGYRLPQAEERWKPYYRFEYINTPESHPIFGVPDLVMSIVGLRYDISDYASFKGEYRNTRRQAGAKRVNGLFLQTSITF